MGKIPWLLNLNQGCGSEWRALSGPFLVSRTGDAGWTERWVKVPEYTLIRTHKRCWFI